MGLAIGLFVELPILFSSYYDEFDTKGARTTSLFPPSGPPTLSLILAAIILCLASKHPHARVTVYTNHCY